MSFLHLPDNYLDVSHGDPLFPFHRIWELAAAKSNVSLSRYNQNTHRSRLSLSYREHLMPIHDYFNEAGFKKPGWAGVGLDCFLMLDGGTSRSFHMLMKALLQDVEDWNKEISFQNKNLGFETPAIKPVILMPIPTYGHFLREMEYGHDFQNKIECVTLLRDPKQNWAVDLDNLKETIRTLAEQGKRVIAYFDSNPNNPTGYVRGQKETEALGRLLMQVSDYYERADELPPQEPTNRDLFENISSFDDIRYLPPSKQQWRGPSRRITLIDDMVYDGLTYDGSEKPVAFSQALPECKDWVVLTGPSKNGLAALRAGLVVAANNELINIMREQDTATGYCASEITMSVLSHFFNNEAQQKNLRDDYQKNASDYYAFASQFMKAMVNGLPEIEDEVSAPNLRKMRYYIRKTAGLSYSESTRFLDGGIDGLKITTSPQAGFFHLLDGKGLKGKGTPFFRPFCDERDMDDMAERHHLHIASGNYTGLPIKDCTQRLTCALPPQKLVEVALRLRAIVNDLK